MFQTQKQKQTVWPYTILLESVESNILQCDVVMFCQGGLYQQQLTATQHGSLPVYNDHTFQFVYLVGHYCYRYRNIPLAFHYLYRAMQMCDYTKYKTVPQKVEMKCFEYYVSLFIK